MTEINGKYGKLAFCKKGQGPAVIFLHGFAEDHSIWDRFTSEMQKQYTCITPDFPGTGLSAMPSTVSIALLAESIEYLLQQLKIEQAHLIGHSMGGYVALSMAVKNPTMYRSLTFFHSTVFTDDAAKKEARLKSIDFIKKNGKSLFLESTLPGLFKNPNLHHQFIEQQIQNNRNTSESLIKYYRAMMERPDLSNFLPTLSVPIAFIIGEHDKAVPFTTSLKQCHLAKFNYVLILRESAHMGMIEEFERSYSILAKFLHQIEIIHSLSATN